jgi:ABC-2 type transport system ATP-binding protein
MGEPAIEARRLTKSFGRGLVAVKDLDLAVSRGTVYGLVGRNGSGKTTALRLMLGLLQPDAGTARVLGWDFWHAPRRIRRRVAYISQSPQMPSASTLEDLERF